MKRIIRRLRFYELPHFYRYFLRGERLSDSGKDLLAHAIRIIMEDDFKPVSMREIALEEKIMKVPSERDDRKMKAIYTYLALVPLLTREEFKNGYNR